MINPVILSLKVNFIPWDGSLEGGEGSSGALYWGHFPTVVNLWGLFSLGV